jgi:hypothetical protein
VRRGCKAPEPASRPAALAGVVCRRGAEPEPLGAQDNRPTAGAGKLTSALAPRWRNRQTRRSQKPLPARAWGFESPSRHQHVVGALTSAHYMWLLMEPARFWVGELTADPEFLEDVAQVVVDRARADEEPRRDLAVGCALTHKLNDLQLLGRQRSV